MRFIVLLSLFGATGAALLAEDRAPAPLSPPEWLIQSVSLRDDPASVAARFRTEVTRLRTGRLTTLAYYSDPIGAVHSNADRDGHDHSGHVHGEADPCNAQPAWSIQVRDGKLQSIIASPETPVSLDVIKRFGLRELAAGQVGGIGVQAWALDGEQALVAIGVDRAKRTCGQWVLVWRSLLPLIYPELAKLIRNGE